MSKEKAKAKAKAKKRIVAGLGNASLNFGGSSQVKADVIMAKAVTPKSAYSFVVKGMAKQPVQIVKVDGKDREFSLGSTQNIEFDKLKLPKAITTAFMHVAGEIGDKTPNLRLSLKAGYGLPQVGWTKASFGNTWRGFLTFTDGQLCCHHWPERGISVATLAKLRNNNGLSPNRQGSGWLTVSFPESKQTGINKFCLDVVNLLK